MNGVNTDELPQFLDFTRDREVDVRFIEWMPFDDNQWKDAKFFSYQVRGGMASPYTNKLGLRVGFPLEHAFI